MLGVSRPAVREALQRLSQARLVEVRHGGSTTVRDFRTSAGLDLLPRLLVRDGELDPAVGPQHPAGPAGHRAGRGRAGRRDLRGAPPQSRCSAAVARLEQAQDSEARQHAALAFWDAVVDAADSIVFRLLFNSLRLAYEPAIAALGPVMEAEVDNVAGYRALAEAIAAGDRDAARAAADEPAPPGHRGARPACSASSTLTCT